MCLQVKVNKSARRCSNSDVMAERNKVKITVLKRTDTKQISGDNPPQGKTVESCSMFEEGQEFIVNEDSDMPEGFCHWAWNDLYARENTILSG